MRNHSQGSNTREAGRDMQDDSEFQDRIKTFITIMNELQS